MTQASIITEEMRGAVGRESEPVSYEVDNLGCRQFARAVGYTDLVFYDEDYARSKGYRGLLAPPGFLGHPVFIPGKPARGPEVLRMDIPLKRVLKGGTDIEYFDDVCAGDRLAATSQIVDIAEREGRLGPMLIVQMDTTYRNEQKKTVAVVHGTVIRY